MVAPNFSGEVPSPAAVLSSSVVADSDSHSADSGESRCREPSGTSSSPPESPARLAGPTGSVAASSADAAPTPALPRSTGRGRKKAVSERKRAANKANAEKSTGPRTAEGKARSATNALRHGLFSQTALFPGEDPQELIDLTGQFTGDYAPVGPMEHGLVERLVSITWRLRRIAETETFIADKKSLERVKNYHHRVQFCAQYGFDTDRYLGEAPTGPSDAAQILADSLAEKHNGLQHLAMLDLRFNGQYLSTIRQLSRLREVRFKEEREQNDAPGSPGIAPSPGTPGEGWGGGQSVYSATDSPNHKRPNHNADDGAELPWERDRAESIDRAVERENYERAQRVDREAWLRAIDLAREQGEAAGREKAIAELQQKAAVETKPTATAATTAAAAAEALKQKSAAKAKEKSSAVVAAAAKAAAAMTTLPESRRDNGPDLEKFYAFAQEQVKVAGQYEAFTQSCAESATQPLTSDAPATTPSAKQNEATEIATTGQNEAVQGDNAIPKTPPRRGERCFESADQQTRKNAHRAAVGTWEVCWLSIAFESAVHGAI